jgi:hypothetical protein
MREYQSLKDASVRGICAKIIFANAYDLIRLMWNLAFWSGQGGGEPR